MPETDQHRKELGCGFSRATQKIDLDPDGTLRQEVSEIFYEALKSLAIGLEKTDRPLTRSRTCTTRNINKLFMKALTAV